MNFLYGRHLPKEDSYIWSWGCLPLRELTVFCTLMYQVTKLCLRWTPRKEDSTFGPEGVCLSLENVDCVLHFDEALTLPVFFILRCFPLTKSNSLPYSSLKCDHRKIILMSCLVWLLSNAQGFEKHTNQEFTFPSWQGYLLFNATKHISGARLCLHLKVKRSTGSSSPCHTSKVHWGYLVKTHMYGGLVHKYEASFQREQHSTASFVGTGYAADSRMTEIKR